MSWPRETGTFALGDLEVEHGGTIRDAQLTWESHGTLSPSRDNVVLYPCSFGAQHGDLSWLIGPDGVLDPTRWFVVVPDMFGNGASSSPADDPGYPHLVTTGDNVGAQRRLLTEHFGVDRVAAVYGFSMGGQQAYAWAALHPGAVERIVVVCGSARTSPHNRVFLSGLLRVLEAAPEHLGDGSFSAEPHRALRAFAHVYAGWALSQDFYREGLHRSAFGASSLEGYLHDHWERRYDNRRAANLYAQLLTWSHHDISRLSGAQIFEPYGAGSAASGGGAITSSGGGVGSASYAGQLDAALRAIRARVLLLPSRTDLYFRVADNALELPSLADGELRVIPSGWGHLAGNPVANPVDAAFLRAAVRDWLDR